LFWLGVVVGFLGRALQTQQTLVTQAQHVALLGVGHGHPAKTLFAAAQATTAESAIICLTDTTARAWNVKKL